MAKAVRRVGGYAVCLADVELYFGDFGFGACDKRAHAPPHSGDALGVRSQHEAGHIQEYDDRQVEGIAEVDEVAVLLCGPAVHSAREAHGIAADDAHAVAVQAREAGYERTCPVPPHLKEIAVIHHKANELARIVAAPSVGRDDVQELFGASVRRIAGLYARRDFVGGVGQIRYERLNLLEGVLFAFGFVVHLAAVVDVHHIAAEFFFVEGFADGAAHHGRAGGEYLGLSLDHNGEVGHKRESGGGAGDGAHNAGRHGDAAHKFHALPPEFAARQAHMSGGFVGLGAMPNAFDELDVGDAVLDGERLGELAGVLADVVGAAAGYGEVVAADGDGAAVYFGKSHHIGAGREGGEIAVFVVFGCANHRAGFNETARVGNHIDALADGVAPALMLPFHAVGAAQFACQAAYVLHIVNGGFPSHAGFPHFAVLVNRHLAPPERLG